MRRSASRRPPRAAGSRVGWAARELGSQLGARSPRGVAADACRAWSSQGASGALDLARLRGGDGQAGPAGSRAARSSSAMHARCGRDRAAARGGSVPRPPRDRGSRRRCPRWPAGRPARRHAHHLAQRGARRDSKWWIGVARHDDGRSCVAGRAAPPHRRGGTPRCATPPRSAAALPSLSMRLGRIERDGASARPARARVRRAPSLPRRRAAGRPRAARARANIHSVCWVEDLRVARILEPRAPAG